MEPSKKDLDKKKLTKKELAKKELVEKELAKKWYDVKIEALIPATLIYRVQSTSPEETAELIKNIKPIHVSYKLNGRRELKLVVCESGSSIIKYFKNLFGRII